MKAVRPESGTERCLKDLIDGIAPTREVLADFIDNVDERTRRKLYEASARRRDSLFGRRVYFRGLIEISNHCVRDCLYCGIRRSNRGTLRYRLTSDQILQCCEIGYALGYRSFVLQGGEDPYFDDERTVPLVRTIRTKYEDCAITLSLGERSAKSYRKLFEAGANRYLLRHESADVAHYAKLHPKEQTLASRLRCLKDLKEIGYQVGAGFMVGSPFQTSRELATDLLFLHSFQPHMIGIGPFIPHHETPFADTPTAPLERTLDMLAITRLLVPRSLMPATTALGSIFESGRESGLEVGANVVMPNLSPPDVRELYSIYDNKKSTGNEAAESLEATKRQLEKAGFEPDMSRGDWTDG